MKTISNNLFMELRRINGVIAMGWKIVRRGDGTTVGFTSYDLEFIYGGVTYTPVNAFSGTAATSRSTLSVDNMSARVLYGGVFDEMELKGGLWDGAACEVFWICPLHPEWGICPLRGGTLGEFKFTQLVFEVDLRSILQQLQQQVGSLYTLDCSNTLGDTHCRVVMDASAWAATTKYYVKYDGEAQIGSVVKPTVFNGFWYVCTGGASTEGLATGYTSQYADLSTVSYQAADSFGTVVAGPIAPGASQSVADSITVNHATSGGSEPAWPASIGATVGDGGVTWTAIYARRHLGTITDANTGNRIVLRTNAARPENFFQYGTFRWITGNNALLAAEVRESKLSGEITLLDIVPNVIQVGDTFEVVQGCNKSRSTCKGVSWVSPYGFNNIRNMFAFPDMPTEDKSLQSSQVPKAILIPQPQEDDDS